MKKKYELTEETKILAEGIVLHRVRAVRDFTLSEGTKVKAGDFGGWVEREFNLSQDGSAWVINNAMVYGEACVYGNALVYHDVKVYGNAMVYGESCVYDNSEVYENAMVFGNAMVSNDARVCGEAEVYGNAHICGNALVKDESDYSVYKNTWSSFRWFTYTRSNRMWSAGCFYGSGAELIAKAYKDSVLSGKCYEAVVEVQETIDKAKENASKHMWRKRPYNEQD